jgi:hypothetical protein
MEKYPSPDRFRTLIGSAPREIQVPRKSKDGQRHDGSRKTHTARRFQFSECRTHLL